MFCFVLLVRTNRFALWGPLGPTGAPRANLFALTVGLLVRTNRFALWPPGATGAHRGSQGDSVRPNRWPTG